MEMKEITQEIQESQEFNNDLREFLAKNFLVEGKTMTEWKRHFFVKIPDEVSFPIIIRLTQEIARKYQEAARYRDEHAVQLTILDQTKIDRFNTAYNDARSSHESKHGKPLAADSCRAAASVITKDIEDAISQQKVIKDFWSNSCKTLVEIRKHVETMGRALAGDSFVQRDVIIRDNTQR